MEVRIFLSCMNLRLNILKKTFIIESKVSSKICLNEMNDFYFINL